MRFRLIGDPPDGTCGLAATHRVIDRAIRTVGTKVVEGEEFDTLIVNGGASMQHGAPAFHAHMMALADAQRRGKRTMLINSTWQQNPGQYDAQLRALNDFVVRGNASLNDLVARHQIGARRALDLCFFEPVDETAEFSDLNGAVAMTDLHAPDFGFVWLTEIPDPSWVRLDLRSLSWSSLVRTLRTASLLVTGRYHAMYAACRARIPFIPVAHDAHNFDDLLHTARAAIPVCRRSSEIAPVIEWARRNEAVYQKLFDWMAAEPEWSEICPPAKHSPIPVRPPRSIPPAALARMAQIRGDHVEAARHWSDAATASADASVGIRHCDALWRAGDMAHAAVELSRLRLKFPESSDAIRSLMRAEVTEAVWRPDRTLQADGWWDKARAAVLAARDRRDDDAMILARDAVNDAIARHGPPGGMAARYLLSRRVRHQRREALARTIADFGDFTGVPQWIRDHDELIMHRSLHDYDSDKFEPLLARLKLSPVWMNGDVRAEALLFLWDRDGESEVLLDQAMRDFRERPTYESLATTAATLAVELGQLDAAREVLRASAECRRTASTACPPLGALLAEMRDLPESSTAEEMAWLNRELEAGRRDMVRLLADQSKRLAVVGNSPCEFGRGHGPQIDAHDVVVRFNTFGTAPEFHRDYGTRTDIAISIKSEEEACSHAAKLPSDVILVFWRSLWIYRQRRWSQAIARLRSGGRVGYLPSREIAELKRQLGCSPSTGLLTTAIIRNLRGSLDRESFFGFSFVDQLTNGGKAHYFNEAPPSEVHAWRREAEIFEQMMKPSTGA